MNPPPWTWNMTKSFGWVNLQLQVILVAWPQEPNMLWGTRRLTTKLLSKTNLCSIICDQLHLDAFLLDVRHRNWNFEWIVKIGSRYFKRVKVYFQIDACGNFRQGFQIWHPLALRHVVETLGGVQIIRSANSQESQIVSQVMISQSTQFS